MQTDNASSETLFAGAARVDITERESTETTDPLYAAIDASTVNDPLYVKALVLKKGNCTVVIITVDAVAVGEIGTIGNDYLAKVRAHLWRDLHIEPEHTVINASHCHGVICSDVEERTVQAVKEAWGALVPVRAGAGVGHEDRITENRRVCLKNGREADVRRAYGLPPDEEIANVGPIDPQIGVLRFDRYDGSTLAVVYNFACHPIQGVPGGGNTADITGFASKVIEECSGDGVIALFLQGCAGDINPVFYRAVDRPKDAETPGNLLGLSTMRALRKVRTAVNPTLRMITESLSLPIADLEPHIDDLRQRQDELLSSLHMTPLNLKSFLSLIVKYRLFPDFPSYDAHHYLHEDAMGWEHFSRLDEENRRNLELYTENIHITEELIRLRSNLELLIMHQEKRKALGKDTIDVEVTGLRIGDCVLVTFPGELSVQIGLDIKRTSPHEMTFVAGVTNGYIYYTPTAEQLENRGGAQEDSDCIVAEEWQRIFEETISEILRKL